MGAWQGVAMDSLKFHLDLPRLTLLHPAGGPPRKQLKAYGRLLPLWTPHDKHLWIGEEQRGEEEEEIFHSLA